MNKRAAARFVVFTVIHVLLCVSAALYALECAGAAEIVDSPESGLYIDGSDFTPLAELMVFSVNGLFSAFMTVVYFAFMTVMSTVLLVPFRLIAVRRFTVVTRRERNAALTVILSGTALALLAAMISGGFQTGLYCLLFLLPTLLIEMLLYWLTLYLKSR
ncbi:MAG: hypothetical protein ACI4WS_11485 [Oscillospiraceae bacterium]